MSGRMHDLMTAIEAADGHATPEQLQAFNWEVCRLMEGGTTTPGRPDRERFEKPVQQLKSARAVAERVCVSSKYPQPAPKDSNALPEQNPRSTPHRRASRRAA